MDRGHDAVDHAKLVAALPSPILVLNPDLVIVEVNQAYLRAVGRTRDELIGVSLLDALPHPEDPMRFGSRSLRASLERARDSGKPDAMGVLRYDISFPGEDFVERYWSAVNVPIPDDDGRTALILHRAEDVTDVVRSRPAEQDGFAAAPGSRSVHRALRDPMTGLLLRSVFQEELSLALSRLARRPHPLAVLFVDLDRLKSVNDAHGHAAGDELITCCAERLRAAVRPSDVVARFGGDEFVLLLDDLQDVAEAERIAGRLLDSLREPCRLPAGLLVHPAASIGVAVAEAPDISAESLVSHADAAMYRAKQAGRGGYALFDEAAYQAEAAQRRLELELQAALGTDQLLLHYQPVIDLTTGATHAVEALLRWNHVTDGLMTASSFIDVAERSGLIVELGTLVVREACRQLAEWDATLGSRAPRRMCVNVSVPELLQPGFDALVARSLSDVGLEAERLVVEVTETGMAHESPELDRVTKALSSMGCQLAIDDFGTGYSSLSRLARLPADVLKLDGSFVRRLGHDRESTAIVSAVLLLAHDLRKTVVAEGVEDALALVTLRDLGCEHAQGFHLARPQAGVDVTRHLARGG